MSLNGMRRVTFFPRNPNVNATELGHEYEAHSARILEMLNHKFYSNTG